MTKYDYIILGAGASGLMLAYRMSKDSFFNDKSILIIDKDNDKGNDRTWCYWETGEGEWDDLLTKTWSHIFFGSHTYSKNIDITPYTYKMIRSKALYQFFWDAINSRSNFNFVQATVDTVTELKKGVQVITNKTNYFGIKLFNSLSDKSLYQSQKKHPVLQQHFVGWFVKTEYPVFDASTATFMDFRVPQNDNTRFMYILPISKTEALFEYTLFSEQLLQKEEYEKAIKIYLNNLNIRNFEIVEKEAGSIPMTAYKFYKLNSKHILNIGTAGGWTKASTGYTFKNTSKKTKALITFLKTENDLSKFYKKTKFRFYDVIFLDVLAKYNQKGAIVFSSMFAKADIATIFRFLDEESSWLDDFKIVKSVPSKHFIQAFFKRLF